MASHVVVGHLKTTDKNARQQVLEQFEKIVKFSKVEEPSVLRYAITVPRDPTDQTTIYAIEEYGDQKTSDDHIASSPVQALIALFGSQPAVLSAAPKVYQLEYTTQSDHFTRSHVTTSADPYIVFATAKLPSVAATGDLSRVWSKVVRKAQIDERETLMYALLKDKEDATQIGTVECYTDQAAFDAHCKTKEAGDLVSINKEVDGKMEYVALKMFTGWLAR